MELMWNYPRLRWGRCRATKRVDISPIPCLGKTMQEVRGRTGGEFVEVLHNKTGGPKTT